MILYSKLRKQQQQQQDNIAATSANTQQFELLKGLPFFNWNDTNDSSDFNHAIGSDFNHVIGLPLKDGKAYPLFDYEKLLFDSLATHKHLWVKKATGLGVTEFMLRYMAWLCLRDNALRNSQMLIITGPREDLAISLVDRMKKLFLDKLQITFNTKDTRLELNGVRIEAYPSNHLDSARGIKNVSFCFMDEADFFRTGEQQNARDVSERYIGKSNPYIVMVSTPNAPEGLFESIEKEPEETCIYKRLKLDYTYGLGNIYTQTEIEQAKASPSFEREYNLKYLGLIGNVFSQRDIDSAISKGTNIDTNIIRPNIQRSMGIDPSWGSSAFAIVVTEFIDGMINVCHVSELERADFNTAINHVLTLCQRYKISKENGCQIFVDAANPSVIRSLKHQLGEREDYEQEAEWYKHNSKTYDYLQDWLVCPIPFSTNHKQMLSHTKKLMESDGGMVAINPKFDKLITSLRTVVANEYSLDKDATSYDDIFDAFRLALMFYH